MLALFVGIALFGRGRGAVARDMVAAAALAAASASALGWMAGPEWPDVLPVWIERDSVPSFPVVELSLAVAVIDVARPYLAVQMRRLGNRLVTLTAASAIVMSYGTLSGTIGAVALGLAAAAAIHLIFGSGAGIPSKDRVSAALANCGIDTVGVEYVDHQPVGATHVKVHLVDGGNAFVKVYGRDAADAAFAFRLWQRIWYRNSQHSLTATGLQLVEHESLMLLAAARAHGPAPALLGWGRGEAGDAIVATAWPDAPTLTHLDAAEISDAQLDAMWHALTRLHNAGIAHSAIDGRHILVRGEDVMFDNLSVAIASPDAPTVAADRAQLLSATAVTVGRERAIAAAQRNVNRDDLITMLSLLQRAVLTSRLERDVHDARLKLADLRGDLAIALGTEPPQLAQLRRVTWKHVASVVFSAIAAYALISKLADIGFRTIADQMAAADWSWVGIAFVLAQLTNVGEYISLTGTVTRPLPFGPTIMFRYASAFVGLAVPGDVGGIAMNARYMQKLGIPTARAVAQGPILLIVSRGLDVILLALSARFVGKAVDVDVLSTGVVFRLLAWTAIVAALSAIVMFSVPKLRNRLVPPMKEGLGAVKDSLTDPRQLLRLIGGTLLQKILFATALSASVAAYGGHLDFGQAVFVNVAASLLTGLVPVPGGVGVGETALAGGLTAVGVPAEVAAAAAITHRLATSYLPPIFGFFSSRWLTEREYL
ncbi:MAG TPA: lysylphosphatidylglycerol synthase transmembrane domain-containing protein [Acidimicrobiales bacterium]|nr:lysylphosphatidylglycerol synthase transmembrane domain-containing protein [Acidimicrobiales bacterium]